MHCFVFAAKNYNINNSPNEETGYELCDTLSSTGLVTFLRIETAYSCVTLSKLWPFTAKILSPNNEKEWIANGHNIEHDALSL